MGAAPCSVARSGGDEFSVLYGPCEIPAELTTDGSVETNNAQAVTKIAATRHSLFDLTAAQVARHLTLLTQEATGKTCDEVFLYDFGTLDLSSSGTSTAELSNLGPRSVHSSASLGQVTVTPGEAPKEWFLLSMISVMHMAENSRRKGCALELWAVPSDDLRLSSGVPLGLNVGEMSVLHPLSAEDDSLTYEDDPDVADGWDKQPIVFWHTLGTRESNAPPQTGWRAMRVDHLVSCLAALRNTFLEAVLSEPPVTVTAGYDFSVLKSGVVPFVTAPRSHWDFGESHRSSRSVPTIALSVESRKALATAKRQRPWGNVGLFDPAEKNGVFTLSFRRVQSPPPAADDGEPRNHISAVQLQMHWWSGTPASECQDPSLNPYGGYVQGTVSKEAFGCGPREHFNRLALDQLHGPLENDRPSWRAAALVAAELNDRERGRPRLQAFWLHPTSDTTADEADRDFVLQLHRRVLLGEVPVVALLKRAVIQPMESERLSLRLAFVRSGRQEGYGEVGDLYAVDIENGMHARLPRLEFAGMPKFAVEVPRGVVIGSTNMRNEPATMILVTVEQLEALNFVEDLQQGEEAEREEVE